ncbi:vacuolar import and degradation protein-domain-containing protein [Lipomyces tetrasporus]|uniref:Vacuolar import and degradation protein-domain-containing protein n=1 Tax=Lipomyces tetrasporus TaxID=54092 RepID=A0AAD7VPW1_9ASCO|nr:vacuolar import and degradation protein-domain-containing protein [Lipomyces tetrasporus]KAJ8098257.1 vacuolar import and degradation protein-domain-containing protein [Lipomyces tetrasporus]
MRNIHLYASTTSNSLSSHPSRSSYPSTSTPRHRPVLERASSSVSITASAVPQIATSLPLWTRSDLYATSVSAVSVPVLGAPQSYEECHDITVPTLAFQSENDSHSTMPPVPTGELVEEEASARKKLCVAPAPSSSSMITQSSVPAVVSAPMPLPIESASDPIHTRRALATSSSSFLRSGSKFMGTQQSGRSTYEVHVELKHVDMAESFICGYLHIQGLTEDHPTLTTYFEGQMIGPKYSFITRRRDWGASEKTDIAHWARFPSWRPLAKQAKRPDYCHANFEQRDHIFMRWKECFLVPDHRVRDINGASFAGFYYICFNQLTGSISGLYFHQSSEKYQQLELSHVSDHGHYYSYEFR